MNGSSLNLHTALVCCRSLCTSLQELEKRPLEVVPAEPSELLDRDRYQRSSRDLVSAQQGSGSKSASASAG
jgi:hypothetical protein